MKETSHNIFGDLYKQPFTLAEAAEYLCMPEDELYRMAMAGEIHVTYKEPAPAFTLEDLNAIKPRFQSA